MYTGVCSDVMYVTILAIEYSTLLYQSLLCSNNNSLQLCYVFEAGQSACGGLDSYCKLEMSTLLILCSVKNSHFNH